jgi:hypothetical protein
MEELWQAPTDIGERDLFFGPWGPEYAPPAAASYTFVKPKTGGVNPGMTVNDPDGRSWQVKQPPLDDQGDEGPIEVTLSRVLSAVGYHQPPVYYLPTFTLSDAAGSRRAIGGRFRLRLERLKDKGEWSWQQNPFVGSRPYQGLLVILMMFNSSDLKNSNNTRYEFRPRAGAVERWFVVRDIGTALGTTARVRPLRGRIAAFEREPFITGVDGGYVRFHYHGWHQELLKNRITPADVGWAGELLSSLTATQWDDAFRAGGFDVALRQRYIRRLLQKIEEARRVG